MWVVKIKDCSGTPFESETEIWAGKVDFDRYPTMITISDIKKRKYKTSIELPETTIYKEIKDAKQVIIPYCDLKIAYEIDEKDLSDIVLLKPRDNISSINESHN